MTVVAVSALVVAALSLLALAAVARLVAAERRQAARERATLVDQLLHLAGRTWTPPPALSNGRSEAPPALSYTAHPESLDWEAHE